MIEPTKPVRVEFADPNQVVPLLMTKLNELGTIVQKADRESEANTPGAAMENLYAMTRATATAQMLILGALVTVIHGQGDRALITPANLVGLRGGRS